MQRAADRFCDAGDSLKTPEQGAATSVLLASSPQLAGIGGRYFEDRNQAPTIHSSSQAGRGGVASYALDGDNAARLWDVSLGLIAQKPVIADSTTLPLSRERNGLRDQDGPMPRATPHSHPCC